MSLIKDHRRFGICIFILLFATLFTRPTYAQSYKELIAKFNKNDLNQKLEASDALYNFFKNKNTSSARYYAEEMYSTSFFLKDSTYLFKALKALGNTYQKEKEHSQAIPFLIEAKHIAENLNAPEDIKSISKNLGYSYKSSGNYANALESYFKALAMSEEDGNQSDVGFCTAAIGQIYKQLDDFDNALKYLKLSESNYHEESDLEHEIKARIEIASILSKQNKLEESIAYINETIQKNTGRNVNASMMAALKFELGRIFIQQKEYKKAAIQLDAALILIKPAKDFLLKINILKYQSQLDLDKRNYAQALYQLDQAYELTNQYHLVEPKADIYQLYSKIYLSKDNFEKAHYYQTLQIETQNLLLSQKNIEGVSKIQLEYQEEKTRALLEQKNREIAKKQAEINSTRKINIYLILATLLFISSCGILIYIFKVKSKSHQKLSMQQTIIAEQNEKLKNVNSYLEEKVKERTRALNFTNNALSESNHSLDHLIYKTSHDIRGPLATLEGIINLALMDVKDTEAVSYFEKLQETSSNLNHIFNRLKSVNKINNTTIFKSEIKLHHFISDIIKDVSHTHQFNKIDFEIDIDTHLTIHSDPYLLFVIISNLVSNAIKFVNQSDRIQSFINFKAETNDVECSIIITDNGLGIEPSQYEKIFKLFSRVTEKSKYGGVGLYLVKMATDKLNGRISIGKSADLDTQFKVILPL